MESLTSRTLPLNRNRYEEYSILERDNVICDMKQQQRERVFKNIMANHNDRLSMKFLGLPGIRWAFERMLIERFHGVVDLVGVESEVGSYERSLGYMPGSQIGKKYISVNTKSDKIYCGVKSENCVFWLMDVCKLLSKLDWKEFNNTQRNRIRRDTIELTAVWLDFCGPINDQAMCSLRWLEHRVIKDGLSVPVAITFMVGREIGMANTILGSMGRLSPLIKRERLIKSIYLHSDRFRLWECDVWIYKSGSGSGIDMGVFCGVLEPR